jgi:hypothetical protein
MGKMFEPSRSKSKGKEQDSDGDDDPKKQIQRKERTGYI